MKKGKKNKTSDKILTILIILFVVVTITLIMVWISRSNNLDTNSTLVTDLHNYFSTEDLNNCDGLFTYTEGKVEYEDINSETRVCLAFHKANKKDTETEVLNADKKKNKCTNDDMVFKIDDDNNNKCTVTKIKKSVINDSYKKIYGKDMDKTNEFRIDNLNVCYLEDEYYYCGLSETYIYTLGSESTIYRVIKKAEEKSSNIIIYDYFIKINEKTCFKNYTTATINEECTDKYSNNKDVDYKFMKKYGTEYKHIFKKATDGSYYWVSSEPVK